MQLFLFHSKDLLVFYPIHLTLFVHIKLASLVLLILKAVLEGFLSAYKSWHERK